MKAYFALLSESMSDALNAEDNEVKIKEPNSNQNIYSENIEPVEKDQNNILVNEEGVDSKANSEKVGNSNDEKKDSDERKGYSDNNEKDSFDRSNSISRRGQSKKRRIPFDVTNMTYEEYCEKHYALAIEEYQKNKALGNKVPPMPQLPYSASNGQLFNQAPMMGYNHNPMQPGLHHQMGMAVGMYNPAMGMNGHYYSAQPFYQPGANNWRY